MENPILINARLRVKHTALENAQKEQTALRAKQAAILTRAEEAKTEEDVNKAGDDAKDLDDKLKAAKDQTAELTSSIKDLEDALEDNNDDKSKDTETTHGSEVRSMQHIRTNTQEKTFSARLAAYLQSNGQKRDGITTKDYEAIIPKQIIYKATDEIKTQYNLKNLVDVIPVQNSAGSFNVMKKIDDILRTQEELQANPELGNPAINTILWTAKTRRGQLSYSEEFLEDAVGADYIVNNTLAQYVLNTSNYAISEILKTATPKTAKTCDDIKHILNVDIDPAYNIGIVVSQSGYQFLDTLKDKNDRYLLQDSITSATGKTLLGQSLVVVPDNKLGTPGQAVAFIGDLKRFVKYFDRAEVTVGWVTNEQYGRHLMAAMRFGVSAADKNAGFFVTLGADTPK